MLQDSNQPQQQQGGATNNGINGTVNEVPEAPAQPQGADMDMDDVAAFVAALGGPQVEPRLHKPTDDDPLPSVDLSHIPAIFH